MEDPAETLIRRALGRRPPPQLGPTLVDDVLRRVAPEEQPPVSGRGVGARRWLGAASWLLTGVASIAVLANLEWPAAWRAVAWGLALAVAPLAYSATLWPGRVVALLCLCGGPLLGEPREEPPYSVATGGRASTRGR